MHLTPLLKLFGKAGEPINKFTSELLYLERNSCFIGRVIIVICIAQKFIVLIRYSCATDP